MVVNPIESSKDPAKFQDIIIQKKGVMRKDGKEITFTTEKTRIDPNLKAKRNLISKFLHSIASSWTAIFSDYSLLKIIKQLNKNGMVGYEQIQKDFLKEKVEHFISRHGVLSLLNRGSIIKFNQSLLLAQPQSSSTQPQSSPTQPQPSPTQPQPSPNQPQSSSTQPQPSSTSSNTVSTSSVRTLERDHLTAAEIKETFTILGINLYPPLPPAVQRIFKLFSNLTEFTPASLNPLREAITKENLNSFSTYHLYKQLKEACKYFNDFEGTPRNLYTLFLKEAIPYNPLNNQDLDRCLKEAYIERNRVSSEEETKDIKEMTLSNTYPSNFNKTIGMAYLDCYDKKIQAEELFTEHSKVVES